jgi:hypothetical protein
LRPIISTPTQQRQRLAEALLQPLALASRSEQVEVLDSDERRVLDFGEGARVPMLRSTVELGDVGDAPLVDPHD